MEKHTLLIPLITPKMSLQYINIMWNTQIMQGYRNNKGKMHVHAIFFGKLNVPVYNILSKVVCTYEHKMHGLLSLVDSLIIWLYAWNIKSIYI